MAAMRGLGDLDLDPVMGILEEASWDVAEAFARISGGNSATAAEVAEAAAATEGLSPGVDIGRRRGADGSDGDFSELDLMRLQQEEYDLVFAEERLSSAQRRARAAVSAFTLGGQARRAAAAEAPSPLSLDSGSEEGSSSMGLEPFHGEAGGRRPQQLIGGHGRIDGRAIARALAHVGGHEALMAYGLGDIVAEDDEDMRMHAMLHVLLRSQDEADLQDAMRRSSEEAYSGSFSVPPVNEAVLQRVTKTTQYCGNDEKGQCAVCLMDFEPGDSLRTLECTHSFHMACVDQWLAQSGQCPVCKKPVGEGA